jgi:D-alanine-D-alanine ligase
MALNRLRILLLMGGVSGEHSISIRSGATLASALRARGHEVVVVGVTPSGRWLSGDFETLLEAARDGLVEVDEAAGTPTVLARTDSGTRLFALQGGSLAAGADGDIDVVFPILHGPGGEDGSLQGMLDTIGVAYVGAGCRASALAMDKLALKTLCAGADIAQAEFLSADDKDAAAVSSEVEADFGFPCFVKPANLGSSVGISRVVAADGMAAALAEARRWDARVVVERGIDAREIEVALLGNDYPAVSPPGEIVTESGFYDFDSKYVGTAARLIAPAEISDRQKNEIRDISERVWSLIGCAGMARADFFIEKSSNRVLFNELNTLPGFTAISMYPRLWAEAGIPIEELVDRLLALALDAGPAAAAAAAGR